MAVIYSTKGMDFRDINWSVIYDGENADFQNNINYDFNSNDYPELPFPFPTQDEFSSWTDYPDGEYDQLYLNGYGFEFDANFYPTAGRVTAVALESFFGGTLDYLLVIDTNVSLVNMFAAADTFADQDDDYAVTRQVLNGDDLILASQYVNSEDYLFGFAGADTIFGAGGRDTIYGDSGDDLLVGDTQSDRLFGGAGNDVLLGGSGADRLKGGAGTDWLSGGLDNARDFFKFTNVTDSVLGPDCDIVDSFVSGKDQFDFRAIDADTANAGDQAFGFADTTASANSLWYEVNGADLWLRGDVNGDAVADFEISVLAANLMASGDFLL